MAIGNIPHAESAERSLHRNVLDETSVTLFAILENAQMDDPTELKTASTPQELRQLEQSDLCVTLYTLWDRMRERGQIAGRNLFYCRNDSCVPDEKFATFAKSTLENCEVLVDKGELFVLSCIPFEDLRQSIVRALHLALESL